MFDELIVELGELATLRDEALRRASTPGSTASTIPARIRFRDPPPWTR